MVNVPTMEQFDALELRVAALEQQKPPGEGVPAQRIADCIELFGVNTFSSLDPNANLWGSWPADYSPPSVIAALRWLTNDSRYRLRLREYHYAGREQMQREWLGQIHQALPGTTVTLCPGANATTNDVPTMLSLAEDPVLGVCWVEGLNEPNTDFGSGEVPVQQTLAIQQLLSSSAAKNLEVMGPSIVAGTPHPEGWITGYCGASMGAMNAAMQTGNGHYYPPGCPTIPGTGYSVNEYVGGLWTAYAEKQIHLTEYHPTLYNNQGHRTGEPGWNGERDAYYTLLTLFTCAKNGTEGLWWYALYDYGTTYLCGLFPQRHADNPHPAAYAIRNLCRICPDAGSELCTFTPGLLPFTLEGLTPNCDWHLTQASTGAFYLFLWNSATELGGEAVAVTLQLTEPRSIAEHDLVSGALVSTGPGPQYRIMLAPSVRALVIT